MSAVLKTAIVTGATGSIGSCIAAQLAKQNYRVILPVRDLRKGARLVDSIKSSSNNSNVFLESCDLTSFQSITAFSANFISKYKQLDLLVNNAAITTDTREETKDGLEVMFAVNVFSYYLLIQQLGPALAASGSAEQSFSRIVNVASNYAGHLDVSDLEFKKRAFDCNIAYMQSKQADRMLTVKAAQLYKDKKIAVFACHPGLVTSALLSGLGWSKGSQSADEGAATPVYVSTDTKVITVDKSGTYWHNSKQQADDFAKLNAEVELLWQYCEKAAQALSAKSSETETAKK